MSYGLWVMSYECGVYQLLYEGLKIHNSSRMCGITHNKEVLTR
jgi:hypothetical protein